jgi:hypothetical protein
MAKRAAPKRDRHIKKKKEKKKKTKNRKKNARGK